MHIAILGNGISGITAARFIRKLRPYPEARITVISAETDHFFSRTALMYVYMGHMRYVDIKPYEDWFWEKNNIELLRSWVHKVDFENKKLLMDGAQELAYDKLILACGSRSNKFGWPGQDLQRVHGLYSYQDLEAMEKYSDGLERAVIVGGGLIGIEMAEMFHSRQIPLTMLVREKSYWDMVLPQEESAMINRHIIEHHIDLRLETELKEIIDDGNGHACAVITNKGERIDSGFVGLTAGVSPNIAFLKDSSLDIEKGILVDAHLQTNIPDVYAIGDCAQLRNPASGRRPVEAVWYTGRIMGETVAYNICDKPVAYDPGIWFNSAKFIDIEYQVYGNMPAKPEAHQQSLYWEHKEGRKSIRILYDRDTSVVLGFNLMGVRYRHEVCEKWLAEGSTMDELLPQLKLANFDPEFYDEYEQEVLDIFNRQSGKNLQLSSKRKLNAVMKFLRGA